MIKNNGIFPESLHIFVLIGFAVAQPLYDILSKNANFFVARNSVSSEIVMSALFLSIIVPLAIVLVLCLLGSIHKKIRMSLYDMIMAFLLAVILLPALKRFDFIPAAGIIGIAFALGVIGLMCYRRYIFPGRLLTYLSPAIVIFPVIFLFFSPVHPLVFPESQTQDHSTGQMDTSVSTPLPPIVMVVFDEFPLVSLLDENSLIDSRYYPNISDFSDDAYWFRNATTIADYTLIAIPALLTGRYPEGAQLATHRNYPDNIFTFLSDHYQMSVFDPITQMCPDNLCPRTDSETDRLTAFKSLASDLSVIYLHLLDPGLWNKYLPPVDHAWKDFNWRTKRVDSNEAMHKIAVRETKKDRAKQFLKFQNAIFPGDKPTFYYIHSMLPHLPYDYLPSGKIYGTGLEIKGLSKERWTGNANHIRMAYLRHLLQVRYVDKILGELVSHLKQHRLYDQALVIMTADHGAGFRPNDTRRAVSTSNYQDIMSVPLFIKLPHQIKPIISDDNVELIDVLPTIADVIGIKTTGEMNGHSALTPTRIKRKSKTIFYANAKKKLVVSFKEFVGKRDKSVKEKIVLFGSKDIPYAWFAAGPGHALTGKSLQNIQYENEPFVSVNIDQWALINQIGPQDTYIPAYITGTLSWREKIPSPKYLAIGINGTMRSITDNIFDQEGREASFAAMIPEEAFQIGENKLSIFVLDNQAGGKIKLRYVHKDMQEYPSNFTLVSKKKKRNEYITTPAGTTLRVRSDLVDGKVEEARLRGNAFGCSGWAASIKQGEPAMTVVIFANGKFVHADRPDLDRPDLVGHYKKPKLIKSGFNFNVPIPMGNNDADKPRIRIFAISRQDTVSELPYPKGYPWK